MSKPLTSFRVHLDGGFSAPAHVTVDARDPKDAKAQAETLYPGVKIRKIKVVRD